MTDTLLELASHDDKHDGRVNAILQFVVSKLAGPDGNRVNVEHLFSTLDAYVHRLDTNIQLLVESWNTDFQELDRPFRANHDNLEKPGSEVAMEWLFIRLKRLTIYSHHSNHYYPPFVSAAA